MAWADETRKGAAVKVLALFCLVMIADAAGAQPAQQTPEDQQTLGDAINGAVREGEADLRRRRNTEALASFDRVVSLAPNWGPGHALRASALLELRRDAEAQIAMALALRLAPADAGVQHRAGYMWLILGDLAAAVRAYSRSLELDPANTGSLSWRSDAYAGLGQMDLALADLDRMIVVQPEDPEPHFLRARILAHQGRQAEALEAIGRAVIGGRRDYFYLSWKADFLAMFSRGEEAAAAHREAMARLDARVAQMPPGRPAPWVMETRLNLMGRSGRHAEAIALVNAELARVPDTPAMLAAQCWLRMEANIDLAGALNDCERALSMEPGHPVAGASRARLYLRLQRWAEAEAAFNALIYHGTGRSESNALYGRGLARIQRGDGAQGQRDLREARRRKFDVAWEFSRIGLDLTSQPTTN